MGEAFKYQSSWKTENLLANYYTQAQVNVLISAAYGFIPSYASAPTGPSDGWMYLNTVDNKMYIYYGGTWQELHSLTPPTPPVIADGVPMGLLLALTYQT